MNGEQVEYIDEIIPEETGDKIVQYAMQAVKDPKIVGQIKKVVSGLVDENQPGFTLSGDLSTRQFVKIQEAFAILNFVRHKIRYTSDPYRVEMVYHPSVLMGKDVDLSKEKWSEDCDTIALLTLTFLLALNQEARLVIVGFPYPPGFSHVFCEVKLEPYGWLMLDPSMSDEKAASLVQDIRTFKIYYPQ